MTENEDDVEVTRGLIIGTKPVFKEVKHTKDDED